MSLYRIEEQLPEGIGGKAAGLHFLKTNGFNIPVSFVLTSPGDINSLFRQIDPSKSYAIRSSAAVEDGTNHSFAGQFETMLHVSGKEAIKAAVLSCFKSVENERVGAYNRHYAKKGRFRMNVIVQEMVNARLSGALFTADPVENRRDRMVITVSRGTGEKLMAGYDSGKTFYIYKNSAEIPSGKKISEKLPEEIVEEGLKAERLSGKAVDMEWAVDNNGTLFWLQLRPVTGLKKVHFNELDSKPIYGKPVYTRGNIGEMMPGPVTPLTLSTFARAVDYGLQVFYKRCGVIKSVTRKPLFVHSFYNHLFFEVNSLYLIARRVLLASKENIDFSVVGQPVRNVTINRETGFFRAFLNFVKMVRYIAGAKKAVKRLKKLHDSFKIECPGTAEKCYLLIDNSMQVLFDAYDMHYVTSSKSGSYYSAVLSIISKGKPPGPEDQEKAIPWFSDIPGIESANAVKAVDELAKIIAYDINGAKLFTGISLSAAEKWLANDAPQPVKKAWSSFLLRHGHRSVREAEMREAEWALDPSPVINSLQTKVKMLLSENGFPQGKTGHKYPGQTSDELNAFQKRILKMILPKARKAVARREQTKALAVGVQHRFKKAYRHLGKLLVNEKLLSDADAIYFLTHEEIGKLLKDRNKTRWNTIAKERRNLYPELSKLHFNELIYGIPHPEEEIIETGNRPEENGLTGIPVSRGKTTGKVRIVTSLEEAKKLTHGEIMVAKHTDVGWTPFYSIISGLITEIGSPLSHGAVVAREYGLPAVVGVKGALKQLKTGETICLDAVKGTVKRETECHTKPLSK